jgi:hypothetical protein
MQENNIPVASRAINPPVIVRAWGDEPVRLILYKIDNKRCYVGIETSKSPIGLPEDQVFAFDVDRFCMLSTVFKQGDVDKLGQLWASIPVDDFACNKYKDMLTCLHDQENVTDSERVASGNNQ